MDNWYSRVKEEIKKQQEDPVWMSEDKVTVMFSILLVNVFNFLARNLLLFRVDSNSVTCRTIFVLFVCYIIPPFFA